MLNSTSSEATQRLQPVRASTFQKYGMRRAKPTESGRTRAVSLASVSHTTEPSRSNTLTR